MREHMGLFRGKRTDNGEWVKGFYHYADWVMPPTNEFVKRTHSILPLKSQDAFDVDPATVGECTGLDDVNRTLIFEGDIIQFVNDVFVIQYENGEFVAVPVKPGYGEWPWTIRVSGNAMKFKITGNIHDNPELLE